MEESGTKCVEQEALKCDAVWATVCHSIGDAMRCEQKVVNERKQQKLHE